MKMPLVYIVIVNYNGYRDTLECVESLESISYPCVKMLIVDNGSTNESVRVLKEQCRGRYVLLENDKNLGFAAGNNIGIREALKNRAEYVLLLNNDTIVSESFLEVLVREMEKNDKIGIAGPKVLGPGGRIDWPCARTEPLLKERFFAYSFLHRKLFRRNKIFLRHTYNLYEDLKTPTEVYAIAGSCMLVRSEVFKRAGLLDERTFLYEEEFILSERAGKAGFTVYTVPEAWIIHKGEQTSVKLKAFSKVEAFKSERYFLIGYKNYSYIKYLPLYLIRLLEYLLKSIYIKDYRRNFPKFLREFALKNTLKH